MEEVEIGESRHGVVYAFILDLSMADFNKLEVRENCQVAPPRTNWDLSSVLNLICKAQATTNL